MNLAFRDIRQRCGTRLARVPMTFRLAMGCIGLTLSLGAAAGELGDLLHGVLQHPQVRAAASEAGAARAQEQAATGRYYGAASLSAGWHRYEDKRVVGVYTPGTPGAPLISEEIGQVGLSYALPVDMFGVIAANRERAQKDVAVAELLTRQQTLLKLHQASSAYLTLQSLLRQRDALAATSQRVVATYRRVREEVTRGRAAGVDARYAESELARLEADQAVLEGALVQAQNDLAEASGVENFLPASADIAVPVWESTGDSILPAQIALARRESARAQAEEARRALLPSLSLDASLFRNLGTSDSRDTWAVGAVISMPLGATAYRQADAQQLTARARAEQAEAARRDGERQLAYRETLPVSLLSERAQAAARAVLPAGVSLADWGDNDVGGRSSQRMMAGLAVGVLLLFGILVPAYGSVPLGLLSIVILPLAAIGAVWGLLAFDKALSMPATLGIVLLCSIVIKNSILMVDFIQERRRAGSDAFAAALGAIRLRYRPVMMTAFATIAGMIPIAMQRAVGLERLSPLAVAAIGGLLLGTVLSLFYLPMFYLWVAGKARDVMRESRGNKEHEGAAAGRAMAIETQETP